MNSIPLQFRGSQVKVENAIKLFGPRFFASWILNKELEPVIYIDEPVAKAVEKGKINIIPTLQHEYDEAMLAIELALKDRKTPRYIIENYTGHNPLKVVELDNYGGQAHDQLVNSFPGGSKAYYKIEEEEWNAVYRISEGDKVIVSKDYDNTDWNPDWNDKVGTAIVRGPKKKHILYISVKFDNGIQRSIPEKYLQTI